MQTWADLCTTHGWVLEISTTLAFITRTIKSPSHRGTRDTSGCPEDEDNLAGPEQSGGPTFADVGPRCCEGSPRPHGKTLLTSKCVAGLQIECFHTSCLGLDFSKGGEIATTELRRAELELRSLTPSQMWSHTFSKIYLFFLFSLSFRLLWLQFYSVVWFSMFNSPPAIPQSSP